MGREFIDIFEEWAADYDRSVAGHDPQYEAVFANYEIILDEVTRESVGNVLEFGVGTGNLSERLLQAGHQVIGIEPSQGMRDIVKEKVPNLNVLDGDFLAFPELPLSIDTIVSSYAFHHLTDTEKIAAVQQFADILPENGRVVFADTMFETEEVKNQLISEADQKGFSDLVEDLNREYYPITDVIRDIFEQKEFSISFKQMNDFVWLIIANKK